VALVLFRIELGDRPVHHVDQNGRPGVIAIKTAVDFNKVSKIGFAKHVVSSNGHARRSSAGDPGVPRGDKLASLRLITLSFFSIG
jgi:hypothetical protein